MINDDNEHRRDENKSASSGSSCKYINNLVKQLGLRLQEIMMSNSEKCLSDIYTILFDDKKAISIFKKLQENSEQEENSLSSLQSSFCSLIDKSFEMAAEAIREQNLIKFAVICSSEPCIVFIKNEFGSTLLFNAVKNDFHEAVEMLIGLGVPINQKTNDGSTPLLAAASEGFVETVSYLIQFGGNVNESNNDGDTPLYLASLNNHPSTVHILVRSGAVIDFGPPSHESALFAATKKGAIDVMRILIENGANLYEKKPSGPPITEAARNGNIEALDLLIESGVSVPLFNDVPEDYDPLVQAIKARQVAMAKHLIDFGFCIEESGAVHYAASYDNVSLLQKMISKGCSVSCLYGEEKYTPLIYAAMHGSVNAASFLIKNGASISECTDKKVTVLMKAAENGNINFLRFILKHKCEIDLTDDDGRTALFYAIKSRQIEAFNILIKAGANDEISDKDGANIFHYLAKYNHIDLLIQYSKIYDPNVNTNTGETPLMYAAMNGSVLSGQELLKLGADVEAKSSNGMTALMFAAQSGSVEFIEFLIQNKAKINIKDKSGNTALSYACIEQHLDCAELLIDSGANIYTKANNMPLLCAAIEKDNLDIIKLLINSKANINARDSWGNTALHYAAKRGNKEIINFIIESGAKINTLNLMLSSPFDIACDGEVKKLLHSKGSGRCNKTLRIIIISISLIIILIICSRL